MVPPRLLVVRRSDVTDHCEADALVDDRVETLAAEHRRLQRALDRVSGLFGEVSDVLVESTDRAEIDRRIPSTITDGTRYPAAWIGTVSPADGDLQVSAADGLPESVPDSLPVASLPSAVSAAVDTDSVQCCSAADGEGVLDPAGVGARRLLVVPLCYSERRYGLLGVYGDEPTPLDARERELFGSLGGLIATGLHAVETARLLTTDHVVELRLVVRDASFRLSRIAAAVGGRVDRCGTTKTADGDCVVYLATEATDVGSERLASLPFVESGRVVSATEAALTLSVGLSTVPLDDLLAEFGAVVTETTATADRATLTVELPPHQDVRAVLEALRSSYDSVDLRARTKRERRRRPHDEFTAAVEDRLTDRQQAAIEAAHHNGYFDSPRSVDGEEIAATMGITRQTFHQHLRAAKRKLVEAYVDAS